VINEFVSPRGAMGTMEEVETPEYQIVLSLSNAPEGLGATMVA